MEERVLLQSNCSLYRVTTKECTDEACMVQEESCMAKEEILSGFSSTGYSFPPLGVPADLQSAVKK